MQDLRALREFEYNGKKYSKDQLFQADDTTADYLIYRRLAVPVEIAPGTPITTPIEGENKMLKKETVSKPIPVSGFYNKPAAPRAPRPTTKKPE